MNFNYPRCVADLFPVDLGIDLSAMQPEINECKRRFQQDLWNTICNRVIQGKTEGNKVKAKSKEEESDDEAAENESNFARNLGNIIVNNARRDGRYYPPGSAPLPWSGLATTRGSGAPRRQPPAPMPRRQPSWAHPPQWSQRLSRQQSHNNNDERSQFLYGIRSHDQDSALDLCNDPRYFPWMRQMPQPPPQQQQHPQLHGKRATNCNHDRSFSATSRREILGSYYAEPDADSADLSEAFEEAHLFVAPLAAWSNVVDAETNAYRGTAAAAKETTEENSSSSDGTTSVPRASGERAFVPLITGDWFAKQHGPAQP